MEFLYRKSDHRHLIIFVHGLNGGRDTWQGNKERYFEVFTHTPLVKHYFDIASYTYPTEIFKINSIAKPLSIITGFSSNRPKEDLTGFNLRINDISRPLESAIRQASDRYKTISIITHSMGGLVAKSALTWLMNDRRILEKVKLMVSLSVPHLGAQLANYHGIWASLFGSNPHILDLQVFSSFATDLTQRFSSLNPAPRVICQHGMLDVVVSQAAAIPAGIDPNDVYQTQDDHFSVLLVKGGTSNLLTDKIFKALRQTLLPVRSQQIQVNSSLTFRSVIYVIEHTWRIKVDVSSLSANELNSSLIDGFLDGETPEESLANLYHLCPVGFVDYNVKWEIGTDNYIIKK